MFACAWRAIQWLLNTSSQNSLTIQAFKVRRGLAQNNLTSEQSLVKLSHDSDIVVQAQVFRDRTKLKFFLFRARYEVDEAALATAFPRFRFAAAAVQCQEQHDQRRHSDPWATYH
jgi:hypothetical protein